LDIISASETDQTATVAGAILETLFYLFVSHEQESSTPPVNYNSYGQEQQMH
jgi:hypothetical protein